MSDLRPPRLKEYSDLREFFRDFQITSRKKNAHFNQAAFSRYLGCSASTLNNYLEGRRELSAKFLISVAKKLSWTSDDLAYALKLRSLRVGKNSSTYTESLQEEASLRAKLATREKKDIKKLDDEINFLSVLIIESIKIEEFKKDPVKIATRLGLSSAFVQRAITRLLETGVIAVSAEGIHSRTGQPLLFTTTGTSRAIRSFHKAALEATLRRIREDNADRRYLGSETLALDLKLLPEAKKIVDRCLDELAILAYRSEKPDTVFHAGFQLVEMLERNGTL